ncbi:MAG: hypothetical protein F6K65_42010 [Moorea sp. SIO3C2]|nr:hypothetical protein [Moorena sp. SIO3C2]
MPVPWSVFGCISEKLFDPAVVRYGQQPKPGYEAKHEAPSEAPLATVPWSVFH